MGVYIPNMEMPKCDECFWCIGHRIKCPAGSKDVLLGGRHPCCPLVPVPPHGRLIDADALYEDCALDHSFEVAATTTRINEYMQLKIDAAPTIIPEEEGET